MVRALTLTLAASLAATAASGQDAAFDGAYVGLQGGFNAYDITSDEFGVEVDGLSADGLEGGVMVGYGLTRGALYGAVEAEASVSAAEASFSDGVDTVTAEADYTLGASAILGWVVTDRSLIYGRLGYTRLEATAGLNGAEEDEAFHGVSFGGGAEVALGENVSARAGVTPV